jgi:hypothetical protein
MSPKRKIITFAEQLKIDHGFHYGIPSDNLDRVCAERWELDFPGPNGENLHREDGPAYIKYFSDGNVRLLAYYINGNMHREDGPAYIEYTHGIGQKNTYLYSESWYIKNYLHRVGGPAITRYYPDKTKLAEQWYQEGVFHREDGPADVKYHESGSVLEKYYYLDGTKIKVKSDQGFIKRHKLWVINQVMKD